MTTQENQPAGWYDDGTGKQRWWDGALWGDYAAPALPPVPAGYQPKSRVAAGLLGILLGGFGAHNFYLGYTNKAILQLVLTIFTCGLASLWGLVEGILILTKNENFLTDAYGVPLVD
jgi:TM2 domain-containing membrane protein YozV